MKRGEIWWADLPPPVGRRPVLLLSRDRAYVVRSGTRGIMKVLMHQNRYCSEIRAWGSMVVSPSRVFTLPSTLAVASM